MKHFVAQGYFVVRNCQRSRLRFVIFTAAIMRLGDSDRSRWVAIEARLRLAAVYTKARGLRSRAAHLGGGRFRGLGDAGRLASDRDIG